MAYWGDQSDIWQRLNGPQRAAAMALMEAQSGRNGINVSDARNALGAMINRAEAEGQPLSMHVDRPIYQPITEESQARRLPGIVNSPEFTALSQLAQQRYSHQVDDWVGGATHFLAPPSTMLALEAKDPAKYHSWRHGGEDGRGWTGYDPETGQYAGTVFQDGSHVFLKPKGEPAAPNGGATPVAATGDIVDSAAPNATRSAAAPAAAQPDGSQMDPSFLSLLSGMFGGAGGPGAAAGAGTAAAGTGANFLAGGDAPAAPAGGGLLTSMLNPGATDASGAVPAAPDATANPLGSLGNFGMNAAKGDPLKMAQAAAQAASSAGAKGGMPMMAKPQVNLQALQRLLAQKPMLLGQQPVAGGLA